MVYEMVLFGSLGFWIFSAILGIALLFAITYENYYISNISIMSYIAFMIAFSNIPIYSYITTNFYSVVLCVLLYIFIGIGWSCLKLYGSITFKKNKVLKYADLNKLSDTDTLEALYKKHLPRFSDYNKNMFIWLVNWPISILSFMLKYFVKHFFQFVTARLTNVYYYVYKKAMGETLLNIMRER